MAKHQVTVPDIGSTDPVDVIELLVQAGDSVEVDTSLLVLESAKASVEMPSPVAGKLVKWLVKLGDSVNTHDVVAEIETAEGVEKKAEEKPAEKTEPVVEQKEVTAQAQAEVEAPSETEKAKQEAKTHKTVSAPSSVVHAGPAVRKLARQMGIDLAQVTQGTGVNGRIVKDDVYRFVKQGGAGAAATSLPDIDFSQFGAIDVQPLSTLRQTAAKNLQQGWQIIPQVTQHDLVDVTELDAFRKAQNQQSPDIKLSLLAFVAKAAVAALKAFPHFNSSLAANGKELVIKQYYHMGFAVDTERGLLVPVLKNIDQLGVNAIAQGVASLAEQARNRKLQPKDMQGASFTITSLGGIGGTAFTPLVNHPQVAILGISRADWQPVWNAQAQQFEPRLMLPLSLSYDHRVIDGADAARFVVLLRDLLSDVRRLLL